MSSTTVETKSTNGKRNGVETLLPVTLAATTRFDAIDWDNLEFGKYFADHMFVQEYGESGWQNARIVPYGKVEMEPSLCTLHYGQAVFEGQKGFLCADGSINLFRPKDHMARLNRSCDKLCIPRIDEAMAVRALEQLVAVDRKFIPKKRGTSLYIRPFIFGSDNALGVRPSHQYLFYIITSPVASYYKEGLNPVRIYVSAEYVRAVRGGLGSAKTPANYAASLFGAQRAKDKGYTQVLWLDGITHELVDEVGTMNIFFYIGDELLTPPLDDGTILAGITRDSVITLARSWGVKVREYRISIEEVVRAYKEGKLREVFGTGTAAVISPVGELTFKDVKMHINGGDIGPLARKLYDEITGIQYGMRMDPFEWTVKVP